jgi:hypothetical protein
MVKRRDYWGEARSASEESLEASAMFLVGMSKTQEDFQGMGDEWAGVMFKEKWAHLFS